MTLNPQDLVVMSFSTSDDVAGRSVTDPIITDPNDPTPATGCYDCPRATQVDCA